MLILICTDILGKMSKEGFNNQQGSLGEAPIFQQGAKQPIWPGEEGYSRVDSNQQSQQHDSSAQMGSLSIEGRATTPFISESDMRIGRIVRGNNRANQQQ